MTTQTTSLSDLLSVLRKEGKRRLLTLTALFSVSALIALAVVLTLPKRYDASALILAESSNLKPLLEGRAVPTGVSDQTAVVNQIVMGRKTLREILVFGGWIKPPPARQPDAREEERLLNRVRSHIKIESTHEEMIRVSFSDDNPKRTYQVANKLADIYLRESSAGMERASRDAFEFLDKQVQEYADKLTDIHGKVLAQYRGQEPTVTAPTQNRPRPTARPQGPRISPDELAALRAEEAMLSRQLARKAATPAPRADTRTEEQYRSRTNQLQGELDRLLVSYTDDHPDVRRVRRELSVAQDQLRRAELETTQREASLQAASARDDDMAQAARLRLEDVQRQIAAATGTTPPPRATGGARQAPAATPEARIDPEMRGVSSDATLSELLRRYEATRDIYQDLLKRRENARVSMELEAQHRGFTLRIQEAAELPATASGLRLMHLTLIGLFLATMVPLGFLFAIVSLDRRLRSPQQVERLARVPLLVSISYNPAKRDKVRLRTRGMFAALMIAGVLAAYAVALVFKLKSSS